jgi:Flp pilus assembly protein TadD
VSKCAWPYAQLLLVVMLAGCATSPADDASKQASKGVDETANQLYAGEPAIVHGTEYPVTSAADGIQRGDQAYREGKLDLAIYMYVESLKYDATAAEPFLKIGAIHEQRGNRALAEKAFELALERQPDNAAACERLGLLYIQSGRDAEAPALFQRALKLDSKRWRSYNGLGVLADRRNDFEAAIGYYDRALEIDPAAATVLNNRGYSHYLAGDLPRAENDLKAAIRLGAQGGVWTNLGKVQAKQGRYPEALESLLKEMDLAHAYNVLGEAAMESADYSRAKRYFESAIEAAPRYYEAAQRNLGLAKERLLAAPATSDTKVVLADTPVYADGGVIGLVERDDRVELLRTQQGSSLVRFRNRTGTQHVGWVPSTSLADPP